MLPANIPLFVRLSCHDWAEGGNTPDDAVIFAHLFQEAGADLIDCSSGQVAPYAKPVYGRMYQTPFSDQIRNTLGVPTMAVGAISEADHANSIIAARQPFLTVSSSQRRIWFASPESMPNSYMAGT